MRRKRIIIFGSMLVVVLLVVLYLVLFYVKKTSYGDPVDLNKFNYYYTMIDSYGPKYEEEWFSTDGHISLTINNKKSVYGSGRYKGTYQVQNKIYNIEIMIEGGVSYGELSDQAISTKNQLYFGTYTIDYINDILKIKVNNDFDDDYKMIDSIYKNGDEIIFKKTE